jgi:hypothetical protein
MDNQETLTPLGTQDTERRQRDNQNGQSRDTNTIWVHKTQNEDKGTIKNGQSRDTDTIWQHKTQDEDKGTIKNGQSRDTDNIWVHKTQNEDAWTIKNGQSRDTDTIGYTRHRTKTKGQSRMDNQETLTLFGTQDTERRQRGNQEF